MNLVTDLQLAEMLNIPRRAARELFRAAATRLSPRRTRYDLAKVKSIIASKK